MLYSIYGMNHQRIRWKRLKPQVLKVLGHPVRLQILSALAEGEECVCHLTAMLGLRQAYVSQQLAILRRAGLVLDRRDGLNIYYRISDPRVRELLGLLENVVEIPKEVRRRIAGCPCPKCQVALVGA